MPRGFEVDWVLIRVNTVRKVVAIAATGLLAAMLAIFAYWRMNPPPEVQARRAIKHAEEAHLQILGQPLAETWRGELAQAEGQLETARTAYANESWSDAIGQANEARRRFEALVGTGSHEMVGVGQFVSLEGRVSVQRAGKADWSNAAQRMPLFNGDFVKTTRDGSAEILFSDGTLYRISPNSLLEIHQPAQGTQSSGSVKMVVGHINVQTSDTASTVTTESTSTQVARDSKVTVGVAEENRTTTTSVQQGEARVRNPQGQEMLVEPQEQVVATDGAFSQKQRVPGAPIPIEPANNAGFELATNPIIELRWNKTSPNTLSHLQISRSKRFLDDDLDVDAPALRKEQARLKAVAPGTYYWRLAAVEGSSLRSEWSLVRRFQIFGSNQAPVLEDHTPPTLELKPIQQMGHLFIVEGKTEVGATVTINGEPVEVGADGSFSKTVEARQQGWNELQIVAVDPSGNRTPIPRKVYVEGF